MNAKVIAFGLVSCGFALCASAETLVWTGAGTTDNFSDAANWSPAQVPASGDSLTFQGETRTAPVNDLDPAACTFKTVLFENDGSAGKAAAFSLSGNELRISTSLVGAQPSSALTETFDLDVAFTGNATLGGNASGVSRHHFTFNGRVSGPANARLSGSTQYSGSLRFLGPVEGFSSFYRPNGGANVYFLGANDAFASGGLDFNQGNIYFVDAANVGPMALIRSGQGAYSTAGIVIFTPTNDVVVAARIGVTSPSQENNGLTLRNETAGSLVTFTGEVYEAGTKNEQGTRLVLDGAGDGRFEGDFKKDRMALYKGGSGTWTLGAEIESCALTGLVTVAAGKLVVDCALPTYKATVAANATLGGTGTLGAETVPATVSFAAGAKLEAGLRADGTVGGLAVNGTVSLAGNVAVGLPAGVALAKGSRVRLLSYGAKTGAGIFTIGPGFPEGTVFSASDTALVAEVPSDLLVWTGDAGAAWNTSDLNWFGGARFADRLPVEFPDIADAAKRTVAIPAAVGPLSMSVTAAAAHPYVFSGEGGLKDVPVVRFDGAATNVWSAPLENVELLTVAGGALALDGPATGTSIVVEDGAALQLGGSFTGGSILVERGGAFTQSVDSVIAGDASVSLRTASAVLSVPNAYTGGFTLGWNKQTGDGNPVSEAYVYDPDAIGDGDVTLNYAAKLYCNTNFARANHTLHIWGYNNASQVHIDRGCVFDWAGDIVVHEYPQTEMFWTEDGTGVMRLGNPDGSSTFSTTHGRTVTLVGGDIHLFARYESGAMLSFRGTMYLYSTNNVWSSLGINTGALHTMVPDALPGDRAISMLQQWNRVSYYSTLDLHGNDQMVAGINTDYNHEVKNGAILTSEAPATFTVSNATDTVFNDVATFAVTGALNLRKMGAGTWTLGCVNTSTGHVALVEGTLALPVADSLPVGEKSKLSLAPGAVLELGAGVAAEIAYAEQVGGRKPVPVAAGLYGGPACADATAKKVDWIAGTGTLRVRRQESDYTILLFR